MKKNTMRHFRNEEYEIFFDPSTGFEILRGVNGRPDPFSLELPSLLDIGVMGHCINKCPFCLRANKNLLFDLTNK